MSLKRELKQWYLRFTTFKWVVGIADFNRDVVFSPDNKLKIHWIKKTPRGSWFADPFILSESEDVISLFVEEFFYSNKKGRISKLVVNKHTWKLEQVAPVIELNTHLSFPAYFREGGRVYIYPESTKSGKLTLYEYDENVGIVKAVKVICDSPLADAVLFEQDGHKKILATTSPYDNGKVLDIYPCDDNPAIEPERKITFKTNVARNAGLPFKIEDRIIRPAQDCTKTYGSCVVLQEMEVKDDEIDFKEIRRFYSPLFRYREAFHTFNVFENRLLAVDAEGFRYGLIAQLVYHLRELLRR